MSEDREQERAGERDSSARPVTAAARRERRASARSTAGADSAAQTVEAAKGARAARPAKTKDSGESKSAEAVKKGRPTRSRDQQDKKRSLFGRLFRFFREVVAELRKVIWPTRKQLVTYTVVVLVFVAFMVALVAGLDIAFNRGVLWLFG
ncbi:preprotein translocase subunit SecE [Goodfellowiella coeruleoviolacea]|uniref:Protein translocase subunit SecE n=1 Tax=Goodfellowiella coeruleoviolacea TaxID=334858 RepID=A0AAE3GEI9_9PSEU|nr:preprotein translocase subunit SecE [Goodfellowiella coeruleoviolacea]MCP2165879.1 preprotein translocase subunit SecE [Goodfellowiella coeruleoviolacea]